jgi:hypothetical protein
MALHRLIRIIRTRVQDELSERHFKISTVNQLCCTYYWVVLVLENRLESSDIVSSEVLHELSCTLSIGGDHFEL